METKKSKSLLVRLFTVLAVLCCCLSLVFGLVGCGAEAKGIKSTSINAQGELIVTYTDGSTDNLGVVVGKDGSQGPQGPQGPTGPQGSAAAWSEVCPEAEDGKHATVKHVVTFGTCTEAETTLEICVNCQASKLNVGELNADNHGSYSWVDIGGAMIIVFDDTCVVPVLDSEYEEANGACPKLYCEACETYLAQHGETEWVTVIEPGVNPCEERHLEVETCVDCHAIVTDATLVEAKGHDYKETNVADAADIVINGVTYATKTVTLTCNNCDKEIDVTAVEVDKVAPTCKAKGYTVFEYTYNDFLADHTVTFNGNEVNAATFHRIPGTQLSYEYGSDAHFNPATTAALEGAIADGKLSWTVVGVGNCSVASDAIYNCADCGGYVVINLYGKHPGFKTEAATCVEDGLTSCTANCGYSYIAEDQYALGHNYVFVTGSFDESANTAKVKCACGAEKTVAVATSVFHEASTCKTPAYTTYTTEEFDNGLDAAHKNYATKSVSFDIVANVPVVHNIGSFKAVYGANIEFTPEVKALIEAGKINWTVTGEAPCNEYFDTVFTCDTCKGYVVIQVSGEHTLDATDKDVKAADCTTRGYEAHKCTACSRYIEVSATDAKGHTFVADEADLANIAKDAYVTFACACGEEVEVKVIDAVEATVITECISTDTITYTFETITYEVETALAGIMKTVEFTADPYVVGEETGSHKLGDLYFVYGEDYEHNPAIAALIEAGKLHWTVTGEAPCNDYFDAVFNCETCGGYVIIGVSGVHDIANQPDKTIAADCLNDGKVYRNCADCGTPVTMSTLTATGHKFETYTVIGAADGNPGYAKSVCANANCPGEDNATPAEDIVAGVEVIDIDANCGFAGKVVYTYVKDGVKVCEDVTFVRPATGDHNDAEFPQVKFVKDGYEYVCFYCEDCEQYVVLSKNPIA